MNDQNQNSSNQNIVVKDASKMWLGSLSSCFTNFLSVFAGPEISVKPEEDPWVIPASEIQYVQFLGSGAQGVVYTGCWRGELVAVKQVKHKYETMSAVELRKLSHPNIVRFLGICTEPLLYGIVMELAQFGSLYQFLHSGSDLLPGQVIKWATDVASGMAYLNENKIIHRDLKSPNVLISDNYIAKVSDFGTCREWKDVSTVMTFRGTIAWMAPEVIRNQLCSDRIDVWSFGVLLWEMMTRQIPYKSFEPHTILYAIGRDSLTLPIPYSCPRTIQVLISQCWQKVPRTRPSFKAIVANLLIVAEEFEAIDPRNFAADQVVWGDKVRMAMENMFITNEAELPEDELVDTQTLRQNLRQARDMYLKHTTKANDVYMDVCATQLQLEQRERDIAEREKQLMSCRCGQRKPIQIRRQESSTSSDAIPKTKQPIQKQPRNQTQPRNQSQMLTKFVDKGMGKTVTVAVESCPCITQNSFNNNLVKNTVQETVVEENGNVGIQVAPVENPKGLDTVPAIVDV